MRKFIIILLSIIILIPTLSSAQKWKRTRYELIFGLCATSFLGDPGGGSGNAKKYVLSIADMDLGATRLGGDLAIRYKFLERLAVKVNFIYGYVSGSDDLTSSLGRHRRELKFSSPIFETSAQAEFSIVKERFGRRYTFASIDGLKNLHINTYIFIGIGGFSYSPTYSVNLADTTYGTPITDAVGRYQMAIPIGLGFKYGVNRKFSFGLEYGDRFTTTDYIDGWKEGKSNDHYMFLLFNLSYKLRTTRSGLPKF